MVVECSVVVVVRCIASVYGISVSLSQTVYTSILVELPAAFVL